MLPKLLIQVRSPWLHFILKSSKKEKVARAKLKLLLVMHGPLNSHLISIFMFHPIRVISDLTILWIFCFLRDSLTLCFNELQISNLQWFETTSLSQPNLLFSTWISASTQLFSRARSLLPSLSLLRPNPVKSPPFSRQAAPHLPFLRALCITRGRTGLHMNER